MDPGRDEQRQVEREEAILAKWDAQRAKARAGLEQELGKTPRTWLAWLLDRVAYGPPASTLPRDECSWLWEGLRQVVSDATAGRWRPERPDRDVKARFTSQDADRAPWSKLPPARQLLLKYGREVGLDVTVNLSRLSDRAVQALEDTQRSLERVAHWTAKGFPYPYEVAARAQVFLQPDRPGSKRLGRLVEIHEGPMPGLAVVAFLELARRKELARRLRLCPYREQGGNTPCGRVFVATRAQKYCDGHRAVAKQDRDRRAQAKARRRRMQNVPANVPASTRKQPKTSQRQPTKKRKTPR